MRNKLLIETLKNLRKLLQNKNKFYRKFLIRFDKTRFDYKMISIELSYYIVNEDKSRNHCFTILLEFPGTTELVPVKNFSNIHSSIDRFLNRLEKRLLKTLFNEECTKIKSLFATYRNNYVSLSGSIKDGDLKCEFGACIQAHNYKEALLKAS